MDAIVGNPGTEDDILAIAKTHFKDAMDAWSENRDEMLDDLKFLAGEQWPADMASDRQADGRPCLTINKLPAFIDQVVGDQLQNRPQIKFLPIDDAADPETADVLTGWLRNVEQQSDAEIAYDTAADSANSCGMGAWRITVDYRDEESFNQEARIERILNRFTVYPDPMAQKWDYSDGRFMFVTEEIPKDSFKAAYPKAAISEWEGSEQTSEWMQPDSIRVAEYFWKKRVKGMLYLIELDDGTTGTVTKLPPEDEGGYVVVKQRETMREEVWWCKMTGYEVLEGPTKWVGDYYPIVLVWGKELMLDKKRIYRGIVRHAKDPQRLYNYSRSTNAEKTALAPKSPYLMTPKQIQNHEQMWNTAHKKNWPYLLYNPDPTAGGVPQRQFPGAQDTSLLTEIQISDQEIHDTTGLQLASMGKKSNEKSGVAIQMRQREGDVANFAYQNNLARAMKYSGKVLLDIAPKILDVPQIIRIIGEDGAEKMVTINQQYQDERTGKVKEHNIGVGKYDVAVTVGPSYTTKRQETAANMIEFTKILPPEVAMGVAPVLARKQDWPGANEFAERIEKYLPLEMRDLSEEEKQEIAQKQQGPPSPPDPMVEMQLAQEQAKVDQAQLKTQQEALKLQTMQVELELKIAELNAPLQTGPEGY